MTEDIEHLKRTKIEPQGGGERRRFLPTIPDEAAAPAAGEAYGGSGEAVAGEVDPEAVRERVVETLKSVYDPEIPVNIYDLGLIYGLEVDPAGRVEVAMTLTAPACPVAGMLVEEVARKVGEIDGVSTSHVKLVWEPPWTMERMTEEARLELGLL